MNNMSMAALCALMVLTACTPDGDQASPQIAGSERQALDQARGVEAQLQQSAEKTRQQIDEASQ